MSINTTKTFQNHLIQTSYGILAMPSAPISTAEVGVIIFVNPSPNWNAITVACLDSPITSEKGAIIGIVSAAFAEPEGMNILMQVWIKYIIETVAPLPVPSIVEDKE